MTYENESIVLTEAVYYILLALHEPLHGYGIMQKIQELSGGRAVSYTHLDVYKRQGVPMRAMMRMFTTT